MILMLCAVVVGVQAWSVYNCWLDMLIGYPIPTAPWWFVERGLITALTFYSSVAAIRVIHHQRVWIPCILCLIAFGLCYSGLIHQTLWGLPTFVGVHLIALVYVIVCYIASLFNHSLTHARSARNI